MKALPSLALLLLAALALFIPLSLFAPPALSAAAGRVSNKDYEIVTLAEGVHGFVWSDPSAQLVEGNSLFIVNDADDHVNGNGIYREAFPGVKVIAHTHTRTDHQEQVIAARKENLDRAEAGLSRYDVWLEKGVDDTGKPIDEARRKRIVDFLATAKEEIPSLRAVKDSVADVTFDTKLVLQRGSRTIEILHLGLGNTRGDAVVLLPKERIVVTGDLLVYPVPFMFGSYYDTWPQTLDKLAALPADTLFLMHGAPQKDREYLEKVQALLRDIDKRARAAAATSLTVEEAVKTVDLKDWSERFAGGNTLLARAFESYVVAPAVERAVRQARKEPKAFTQNLRP